MTFRVAFIGPAGSGKTTMSIMLRDRHNVSDNQSIKLAFADALRWEVACALELRNSDLQHHYFDQMMNIDTKAPYRSALQAWGELRRNINDQDYWCDIVEHAIERAERAYDPSMIIDDCRYPNEEAMLKRRNFIFIRCAPSAEPDQILTRTQAQHLSESYHTTMQTDHLLPFLPSVVQRIEAVERMLDLS